MTPGMQMPMASPTPPLPTEEPRRPPLRDDLPDTPVLRLEDLEKMGFEKNPTLAQAESSIRVSQGRRRQAGLFPNPTAGYFLEEFVFRSPGETAEHGAFVEQTIPLGGKLGKAKRIFARETDQAEALAEAQRQRVLNSVRMLYYEALGTQRLVDLRVQLGNLVREAGEITKELYNIGQADRPDYLEIEIEIERAEIDLLRARNDRERVWRALGAMIGDSGLRPARLAGSLEEGVATFDQEELFGALLRGSPEIKAAQAGVERARAVLARARAERIPDLFVSGGLGYNYERFEPFVPSIANQRKGMEGRLQVGVTVPIFNRNQGGIAAAEAELAIAEKELERLQLSLRDRFASSFREYRNASQVAEKYRTQVIPKARAGYEMYLSNFKNMAAAYPQVLIAQRTLFQVEVEYARALIQLRQSLVGLRGFLLEGGLDPISRPGEFTEGVKLRSPNEATGGEVNRETRP
ncbi:MAG: TolC family protein [Pyrinomonadaceae bacterium]